MRAILNRNKPAIAWAVILAGSLFTVAQSQAHPGHGGGSGTKSTPRAKSGGDQRSAEDLGLDARSMRAPHGGQVSATKWHFFEIVYTAQETRIYVFSPSQRLVGAGGVRGKVTMQVNGNPKLYRFDTKEAIDASGVYYLSVKVDVSRVRDGDMQVAFDLTRLPFREEKRAQFRQTFALTRPKPQVSVARLTEADRPLIDRQRMCPVMDAELTSHAQPIKLWVGDQPLFVCCESCIAEVEKNPALYLRKAAAAAQQNRRPPQPQVSVSYSTQADEQAIRAQRLCPVMDSPLGEHGTPIKVTIDGRPIFVCCKGCIDKVAQNPDVYFRKLAGAVAAFRQPPPQRQFSVSQSTSADRAAIQAQRLCPVMDQPLGEHGTPIKVTVNGRALFVCCRGCIRKVEQNPDFYLVKANQSR